MRPSSSSGSGGSGSSRRSRARRESRRAKAKPVTSRNSPIPAHPHHGRPPKKPLLGSFVRRLVAINSARNARMTNSCDFFMSLRRKRGLRVRRFDKSAFVFGPACVSVSLLGQERRAPLAARLRVLHVAGDAVGPVRAEQLLEFASAVAVVTRGAGRARRR